MVSMMLLCVTTNTEIGTSIIITVAAALAPADVLLVEIDEEKENACHVTVPDTQLSLAIGNKGQNARLAARLTGWKIDIKPESGFYIPQNS